MYNNDDADADDDDGYKHNNDVNDDNNEHIWMNSEHYERIERMNVGNLIWEKANNRRKKNTKNIPKRLWS